MAHISKYCVQGAPMAKEKTWVLELDRERHTVKVEWSQASKEFRQPRLSEYQRHMERLSDIPPHKMKSGKILVDGDIVKEWVKKERGGRPEDTRFNVGDKPAIIRKKGRIFKELELYVDGKLIP